MVWNEDFFTDLLVKLSASSVKTLVISGSGLLEAEVCRKVKDSLKKQLDYMKYYREETEDDDLSEETLKNLTRPL